MAVDAGFEVERAFRSEGMRTIVGVDEVGRGAWAGCVTVGAAVAGSEGIEGIRDSKLLSPRQREVCRSMVMEWAPATALGSASAEEIDAYGMTAALRLAAFRALAQLELQGIIPNLVLLDGSHDYLRLPDIPVVTQVKGDMRCQSIAAASIVAKLWRDAHMAECATSFPGYGFERNVGYPAPIHLDGLDRLGLCSLHRQSWIFAEGRPGRVRWPRDATVQTAMPF